MLLPRPRPTTVHCGLVACFSLGSCALVVAAPLHCPHSEVAKGRAQAEQRMKAGDPAGAIAILKPLRETCGLYSYRQVNGEREVNLDFYWIHSDLSFAYYKAGQYSACLSTLSELTYPGPPDGLAANDLENQPVGKAIAYNERLCETAFTKPYARLTDRPCPDIKRADAEVRDSIALPTELSQNGRWRCLTFHGGATYEERKQALEAGKESDAKKLCPSLVATGSHGKKVAVLEIRQGTLTSPSNCCLVDSISAGVVDGKPIVRLRGQGRDCFGGRAYYTSDEIFELRGSQLVLILDASRSSH